MDLITCKFCNKENVKPQHERFCSKNPDNVRTKQKREQSEMTQGGKETVLSTQSIPSSLPPGDPNPTQIEQEPPLVITDIIPYPSQLFDSQEVAWYKQGDEYRHKTPLFIGLIHDNDVIPCMLFTSASGHLLPAYMLEGFVGIFPKNKMWHQEKQPVKAEEPKPILLSEKLKPEIKPPIIQPKKQGIFARLFAKKEPKKDPAEINNLIKDAINVTP